MTRTYQDSGIVNYRGIQTFEYKTQNEPARMLREISIDDLIREEHSKGRTIEHLAKTYLMTKEEINQILGEEITMRTPMRGATEITQEKITKYMADHDITALNLDDVRKIAEADGREAKAIAKIAGHMGVYTSPAKAKDKEKELSNTETRNLNYECGKRLEEKAMELCLRVPEIAGIAKKDKNSWVDDLPYSNSLDAKTFEEPEEPETIFYSNMSCPSMTASLTLEAANMLVSRLNVNVRVLISIEEIS